MPRQRPAKSSFQLLPIANLATLLVPMGLMATQLVALRWMRPDAEPFPQENPRDAIVDTVRPTVLIEANGLRVLGAESVLAGPAGQPLLPCDAICSADTYDYVGLRRLLGHVRAAYPRSDSLVVELRSEASYDVLVRVFTAVQHDEAGGDLFPRITLR